MNVKEIVEMIRSSLTELTPEKRVELFGAKDAGPVGVALTGVIEAQSDTSCISVEVILYSEWDGFWWINLIDENDEWWLVNRGFDTVDEAIAKLASLYVLWACGIPLDRTVDPD